MITPLGGLYVLIFVVPIALVLLVGCLCVWFSARIQMAIIKHKQNKKIKQRKAQLADLLKEEHEWWLKLNEPEASLSKKEIERYASECQTLREKISSHARSEFPFLHYELPPLSNDGYQFLKTPSNGKMKLTLLNGQLSL